MYTWVESVTHSKETLLKFHKIVREQPTLANKFKKKKEQNDSNNKIANFFIILNQIIFCLINKI